MMNDNISRQAVLEAIQRHFNPTGKEMPTELASVLVGVGVVISTQPSTDRIGHWILDPDGNDWNLPAWICSECHRKNDNIGVVEKGIGSDPRNWGGSKFCPECGARMSGKPEVWKKRCL